MCLLVSFGMVGIGKRLENLADTEFTLSEVFDDKEVRFLRKHAPYSMLSAQNVSIENGSYFEIANFVWRECATIEATIFRKGDKSELQGVGLRKRRALLPFAKYLKKDLPQETSDDPLLELANLKIYALNILDYLRDEAVKNFPLPGEVIQRRFTTNSVVENSDKILEVISSYFPFDVSVCSFGNFKGKDTDNWVFTPDSFQANELASFYELVKGTNPQIGDKQLQVVIIPKGYIDAFVYFEARKDYLPENSVLLQGSFNYALPSEETAAQNKLSRIALDYIDLRGALHSAKIDGMYGIVPRMNNRLKKPKFLRSEFIALSKQELHLLHEIVQYSEDSETSIVPRDTYVSELIKANENAYGMLSAFLDYRQEY